MKQVRKILNLALVKKVVFQTEPCPNLTCHKLDSIRRLTCRNAAGAVEMPERLSQFRGSHSTVPLVRVLTKLPILGACKRAKTTTHNPIANAMKHETIVGLLVTDDELYATYREKMTPTLESYGGVCRYNFKTIRS